MARRESRNYEPRQSTTRRRRGLIDFVAREGSSVLFSAALFYVLWGGYTASLATPTEAMWSVFAAAALCFGYVFMQAFAAAMLPMRRESGPLADILVSLLPMLVLGYTGIDWLRAGGAPDPFKHVVLLMAGMATLIDLIVFTWFSIRLNRFTPESRIRD